MTLLSLGPGDGTTTGMDLLSWTGIPCIGGHRSLCLESHDLPIMHQMVEEVLQPIVHLKFRQ